MKILVIKLAAIGDVLRTTSILPALKEKYPDARISWLTKKSAKDFIAPNNLVNSLHTIEEGVQQLLDQEYDLVISLDDDDDMCTLAKNLKKKKLFGAYEENGMKTYTKDSSPWFDMGLISQFGKEEADKRKAKNKRTYQELIFTGLGLANHLNFPPQLILEKDHLTFGKEFEEKNKITRPVIGINTGAGGRWQDKKLSVQETVDLIDSLNKNSDVCIILFGGPEEKERNGKILKKVSRSLVDGGCDNSLLEFSALVDLCDVLVTSDSLAMHIGIALRKKIVAFFYPTSAAEIELYGRGKKIIASGKSYCSYKAVCDDPPRWDVEKIVNAAKEKL